MRRNEPTIDQLPEFTSFKDMGCDIHPRCLTCPLPKCRYDEPGWLQREERTRRDTEILQARADYAMPVIELAERYNVSTRTVHRILSKVGEDLSVMAVS